MKPLYGYDIDGVLVPRLVVPLAPYVVISGRLYTEWERTVSEIGTDVPIYLRPHGTNGDKWHAAHWKATMIKHLGITVFFEDDAFQAQFIRNQCRNCTVHMVPQC